MLPDLKLVQVLFKQRMSEKAAALKTPKEFNDESIKTLNMIIKTLYGSGKDMFIYRHAGFTEIYKKIMLM